MDGRGGCCIARYTPGACDMSKVNMIMLRYRPIAPKPATSGSVSGEPSIPESMYSRTKAPRRKRRYVRAAESNGKVNRKSSKKRKVAAPVPAEKNQSNYGKTDSCSSSVSCMERETTVVTLPLLPEEPELRESPASGSTNLTAKTNEETDPIWLSFGNATPELSQSQVPAVRVVGSWVMVESVTGTWGLSGHSLGRTDQERAMNLERDTCPGFISDGLNRVRWANSAYMDMVGQSGGANKEVVVWLVLGDGVRMPASTAAAFTCKVRVVTCGGKEKISGRVVLCDVWRMDGGGFAWRLDTDASLTLGRG